MGLSDRRRVSDLNTDTKEIAGSAALERVAEDDRTRELMDQLAKEAQAAVTATSDAERQSRYQAVMHTGQSVVNHAATAADTSSDGGWMR